MGIMGYQGLNSLRIRPIRYCSTNFLVAVVPADSTAAEEVEAEGPGRPGIFRKVWMICPKHSSASEKIDIHNTRG
jgi:hypothetical protein